MRRLAIGALVLVVAAGCGNGKKKDGASANKATTTSAAGGETSTSAAGAAGATTTAKRGTATTRAGAALGPTTPAPPASSKLKPPASGSYIYANQGKSTIGGQEQAIPDSSTLKVEPPQGGRQRSVRETKDDQGFGTTVTTILDYRDDGVYLVYLNSENKSQAGTFKQEFQPATPVLFAPFPAVQGRAWAFDLKSTDGCSNVHTDAKWAAVGENVTIGGKALLTDKVAATIRITPVPGSSCDPSFDLTQNDTQWIGRESRLTVKEEEHTTGTATLGGVPVPITSDRVSTIKSTTPT
jgi:hypothetical protein